MENSAQVSSRPVIARLWPWLFFAIGVFRLADWAHGGRQDWGRLLSGIGFLLMAPGASSIAISRTTPTTDRRARLLLALTVAGAALVLGAIVERWL